MSAFLGPIHHKMYQKITNQSQLALDIAAFSDQNGWTSHLKQDILSQLPLPQGALEDIIDLSNIHGWLNKHVTESELRLSTAVQTAVNNAPERAQPLVEFIQQQAKQAAGHQATPSQTCPELWQKMDLFWLDGMPCDRGVQFDSSEDNEVRWSIAPTVHAQGWADQTPLCYNDLRWNWMNAFAGRQGFVLHRLGDLAFCLTKE